MWDKLLSWLPTRDSGVWKFVTLLGGIAAVILNLGLKVCDPHVPWEVCSTDPERFAFYGIPNGIIPYLRLTSVLVPVVSAWMTTSPQAHSVYRDARLTEEDRDAPANR